MSGIADLLASRFGPGRPHACDPNSIVFDLEVGLTQAGEVACQIYDLVVHPADSEHIDDEAVAATARALLALLAHLGSYVDTLELLTRASGPVERA